MSKNCNSIQKLIFSVALVMCFLNAAVLRAQYTLSPATGSCLTHTQGGVSPSYTFTATGSHSQGTPIWSVQGDLTIVSQTQSPLAVVVRSSGYGKGRVVLTYNQATSCEGQRTAVDVFKTFTPADPIVGPTCVRPGETVIFSVKPVVSSASQINAEIGVDTYQWKIDDVPVMESPWWMVNDPRNYISGDGSAVHLVVPSNLSSNPVLSVSVGGCNTATPVSLTLSTKANVPVFSGPVPSCIPANNTAPFVLSVVNEPGVTYTWSGPAGWVIDAPVIANGLNTVTITPDNSAGEITVVAKASNAGCESAVNKVFISRQLVTSYNTITSEGGCLAAGTPYTFTLLNAPANTTYEWTVPPGWTPSGFTGGSTVIFSPGASAQPGSITVKNTVCTAGVISATPEVSNIQGLNFIMTDLDCGLYRVNATGFVRTGCTYQWLLDGVLQGTTSDIDNAFTFEPWTGSKTVSVKITKPSPDCVDRTVSLPNRTYGDCLALREAGAGRAAVSQAITVYPNPANNHVTVTLPAGDDVKQVSLTDQYGQVQKRFNTLQGSYTLDVSTLPRGIYMLTVKTGTETVTKRIKLER